jgi:hypothetical protein
VGQFGGFRGSRTDLVELNSQRCRPDPGPIGYHGRNVDAGRPADTAEEPVDEYLLQIWPAPPSAVAILKRTSTYYASWRERRLT